MNKAVYAVLQIESEWRIVCARRHIGRFTSRNEALSVAAGLVKTALQAGLNAELLVLDAAWKLVGEHFRPGRAESLELAAA
jgi:hypothetical protein